MHTPAQSSLPPSDAEQSAGRRWSVDEYAEVRIRYRRMDRCFLYFLRVCFCLHCRVRQVKGVDSLWRALLAATLDAAARA